MNRVIPAQQAISFLSHFSAQDESRSTLLFQPTLPAAPAARGRDTVFSVAVAREPLSRSLRPRSARPSRQHHPLEPGGRCGDSVGARPHLPAQGRSSFRLGFPPDCKDQDLSPGLCERRAVRVTVPLGPDSALSSEKQDVQKSVVAGCDHRNLWEPFPFSHSLKKGPLTKNLALSFCRFGFVSFLPFLSVFNRLTLFKT